MNIPERKPWGFEEKRIPVHRIEIYPQLPLLTFFRFWDTRFQKFLICLTARLRWTRKDACLAFVWMGGVTHLFLLHVQNPPKSASFSRLSRRQIASFPDCGSGIEHGMDSDHTVRKFCRIPPLGNIPNYILAKYSPDLSGHFLKF